jgi:DHA1 family bicyclomycin/chloramphenicol resistance-like MFS transporter
MFIYISASAFVLIRHYGLTPLAFGGVFAVTALALVASAQVNARLVRRFGPAAILRWSQPALLAVGLFLAVLGALDVAALWPLLLGLAAFLGTLGFINANTTALAMNGHPQQRRGTASGLLGTLQFTCGATAGALVSLVPQSGPLTMGVGMAASAALSWAALRWMRA